MPFWPLLMLGGAQAHGVLRCVKGEWYMERDNFKDLDRNRPTLHPLQPAIPSARSANGYRRS